MADHESHTAPEYGYPSPGPQRVPVGKIMTDPTSRLIGNGMRTALLEALITSLLVLLSVLWVSLIKC
jgi:hypothetical protein